MVYAYMRPPFHRDAGRYVQKLKLFNGLDTMTIRIKRQNHLTNGSE